MKSTSTSMHNIFSSITAVLVVLGVFVLIPTKSFAAWDNQRQGGDQDRSHYLVGQYAPPPPYRGPSCYGSCNYGYNYGSYGNYGGYYSYGNGYGGYNNYGNYNNGYSYGRW